MSDNNRKNTRRVKKSEDGSPKSEPERKATSKSKIASPKSEHKTQKPKPKAVKTTEEIHSETNSPQSEIKPSQTAELNKSEIVNSEALLSTIENKQQAKNPKSEIKQMEVHHHPEVEKKGLKEYLLEGLMIFIAVMMGFIAENIREDITNKEHARQLTSQLVQDLKADTVQLNKAITFQEQIVKANGSLFALSQQPLAKVDLKEMQRLIIALHNLFPFRPSGGASAAIKNELHLKQFAESNIIHHIAQYERDAELAHTTQDVYLQYQRTMLDPFLRQHFTPANVDAAFNNKPLPDAQMRNLTQADLTQFSADMALTKVVSNELIRDYKEVKESATTLLKYVQKEYDLE